ncbi:hypothetical protein [Cohnella sp. GCM10027633]|uniref:hypothetical protein n=1 Tax=unclassified Cohnella TaxID=2636738 RepID=UPI003635A59C
MNKTLLQDGLTIIARCKPVTGDIWHAHYGAAAIAAYDLARDDRIDPEAARRLTEQAKEMVRRHALPAFETDGGSRLVHAAEAEAVIVAALERTIDGLHWVGHNAIYAAHSLRAIRELGGEVSEDVPDGIAQLIGSFERTIPGRSWLGYTASEVKRLVIEPSDGMPDIERPEQLSEFVLGELAAFVTIYRAEAHHDLIGHLLTYSHALNLLHDLGYAAQFKRGVVPLQRLAKALRASRSIPPDDPIKLASPVDRLPLVPARRSPHLPEEAAYWGDEVAEHDWDYGHSFKFPAAFYDHSRRARYADVAVVRNFRYLINLKHG